MRELRLGHTARKLGRRIKGFGRDHAGELYVCADAAGVGGEVLRLVPVPPRPVLLNLSTRARVGTGDNVVIGGFIVTGSAPKTLVLRGLGPSLRDGRGALAGSLEDPVITLFNANGVELASNDNWGDHPRRDELAGLGFAPSQPEEAALVVELPPGAYTVWLRGSGDTVGIGLAEIYDVDQGAPAAPVNISTRSRVLTGDNVMIAGFIIGGTEERRVFVRALGPSLGAAALANVLDDPRVELVDEMGIVLASNDDWKTDQASIEATGLAPGNDKEAAVVRTLAPGAYTAIVRGSGNDTGVALVEAYVVAE